MKKALFSSVLVVLVIFVLGINIYSSKQKIDNFISLNKTIEKLVILDKELDLLIANNNRFVNFDVIENKIDLLQESFLTISKNSLFNQLDSRFDQEKIVRLEKLFAKKKKMIQEIKSIIAILSNSYSFIPQLGEHLQSKKIKELYRILLTMYRIDDADADSYIEIVNTTHYDTDMERVFLNHLKIILTNQKKYNKLILETNEINLGMHLQLFLNEYGQIAQKSRDNATSAIVVLFVLLVLFILGYLVYSYKVLLKGVQFERFRRTVESSDNIVVVTDKDEHIKYVNEAFTKTTGYTPEEVIGKKPNVLKSNMHSKEFYENLWQTIHSGKKWHGEFINVDKYGHLSYEKASITPVLDKSGEIIEFIALKLDVTQEVMARQKLEEKQEQLKQHAKMAALGEMLENIAHQWRQPLSVISTAASGLQLAKETGRNMDESRELDTLSLINDTAQNLSKTINDFSDFFKPDKEKTRFLIQQCYSQSIKILESKLQSDHIQIIENIEDLSLFSYRNSMIQVFINIFNNAKDILEKVQNQPRLIMIDIFKENDKLVILIKDNGGGVPLEIMDKIFEPYFTTKHKSQGTGIGLYMVKEIVEKHLMGTIEVSNVKVPYENKTYLGAEFKVVLNME